MVNSMKMRLKMASGMDAAWKSPYLREPQPQLKVINTRHSIAPDGCYAAAQQG